ncbi:MAG: MFS transporter [Ahrensia sp.]|nr:MFS transporter [Ahrensia sp.]
MVGIVILALCYVLSHFYRSFLAVLSPLLSAELAMTPDELSTALGAWFVAFALSQFLVGILLDRFGPRRTNALMFGVLAGGGAVLFATADNGLVVLIAMILLGIGCAPVLMASLYIFKLRFDPSRFATLMSVFIAVGLLGNILGSSPLAWALDVLGWRNTVLGLAGVTILLAVLAWYVVADPEVERRDGEQRGGYLSLIKLREMWWILPLVATNYAVSGGLRGIWAGPYLDDIHGMTAAGIGQITFYMALALAAGSFCFGPADRFFNTRKWVVIPGASVGLVALLVWALDPAMSPDRVAVVLVIIGFCSMSYGVLMAHATANIPDHLAGRGVTLVNFFNMGGVGVMQWITGGVYAQSGGAAPIDAYANVLWVYVLTLTAAIGIYMLSRDVKPLVNKLANK